MTADAPEPLWREVVGDTEPWRRGRLFLIALALWQFTVHAFMIGSHILLGRIDVVLVLGVGALTFWLLFYFIWIGVHWVRWLSGGFSALLAFANLIWGFRDGNSLRIIDGTIGLPIAAYLALAPSVYFFALRQKEVVRWKESLAVAAVFGLLLCSFGAGIVGLFGYKAHLENEGRAFADRAFRRVFVDGDSNFLRTRLSERTLKQYGWDRMSLFMADRYMKIGVARNLRAARGQLRFWFRFPGTLVAAGRMSTYAETEQGPVRLEMAVVQGGGEWQIDALGWRFVDPAALPQD